MNAYKKIREYIENKADYWYIAIAVLIGIGIVDYGFLSLVASKWVCSLVAILLIIVGTFYVSIIYQLLMVKSKEYMDKRKDLLLARVDSLEECIHDLYEKNVDLEKQLVQSIQNEVENNVKQATTDVTGTILNLSQRVADYSQSESRHADLIMQNLAKKAEDIHKKILDNQDVHKDWIVQQNEFAQTSIERMENKLQEMTLFTSSLAEEINGTINENIHELSDQLQKDTTEINEAVVSNAERVVVLLQDKEEKDRIAKDEYVGLFRDIMVDVQKNRELSTASFDEQSANIEQVKQSIEEKVISVSDNVNIISLNLESVHSALSEDAQQIIDRIDIKAENTIERIDNVNIRLHEDMSKDMEQLGVITVEMQNELIKLLVQILDGADEHMEKVRRDHDRIFDQVLAFSKSMKGNIENLQQTMMNQEEMIHKYEQKVEELAGEQFSQISEWEERIDNLTYSEQRYQQEVSAKLSNLNSQILSLNKLAEMIKNISEMSKGNVVSGEGPNRIEEIKDEESGTVIRNHYKDNRLSISEMMVENRKDYELEYDVEGKMCKSRTFGQNGEVITELHYYPKGQVSTRIEKVNLNGKSQTITSYFDEKGNKKGRGGKK